MMEIALVASHDRRDIESNIPVDEHQVSTEVAQTPKPTATVAVVASSTFVMFAVESWIDVHDKVAKCTQWKCTCPGAYQDIGSVGA
jgi:hypothetical protein